MEMSRNEIIKNRIIAFAITFLALILLLITFALKLFLPEQISLKQQNFLIIAELASAQTLAESASSLHQGISAAKKPAASGNLNDLIGLYRKSKEETYPAASSENVISGEESVTIARPYSLADGISIELRNRELLSVPSLPSASGEGKIVLEITVNAEGAVTEVSNGRGSNSGNADLLNKAVEFAKQIRFSSSAAPEQRGKISIIFRFR